MEKKTPVQVQCFPLYSILAALNTHHVDFFSLDIEGAEIDVLKTIPFGDVTFDSISVEKRVLGDENASERKERDVINILAPHGIELRKRLKRDIILAR